MRVKVWVDIFGGGLAFALTLSASRRCAAGLRSAGAVYRPGRSSRPLR
ncbi:MAG: hypothetical protein ABJ358_06775 [Rhizobiaceae bacterium]